MPNNYTLNLLSPEEPVPFESVAQTDTSSALNVPIKTHTQIRLKFPKAAEIVPVTPVAMPHLQQTKATDEIPPLDKISPYSTAQFFFQKFIFAKRGSLLFVYDHSLGFFRHLIQGEGYGKFGEFIRQNAPGNIASVLKSGFISEVYRWLSTGFTDIKQLPNFDDERYICFKNGVLDLSTADFFHHSPDVMLTHGLTYPFIEYDKKKFRKSLFWQFIQRLAIDQAAVLELRLMLALAISNIRSRKTAFFIIGPSHNGKSVLANLLIHIIGDSNIASIPVSKIGDRFLTSELLGKHVLISSDESTMPWNNAMADSFKTIVARDRITAEIKYADPFQFRSNALIIAFSNSAPQYSKALDAGGAITRRIFPISTGQSISAEEEDLNLINKLILEADVIISWAIKILIDGRFRSISPSTKLHPIDNTLTNTSFARWSTEAIDTESMHDTKSTDLFASYLNFVMNNGLSPNDVLGETAFYMKLSQTFQNRKYKLGRLHFYKGITPLTAETEELTDGW